MTARTAQHMATGARWLLGAAVAVGCVAVVGAGVHAPWPQVAGTAAQTDVAVVPADTVLSCAGPFRVLGRDAQNADLMESAGTGAITTAGVSQEPTESVIETPELSGGRGATVLTAPVQDRQSASVDAAESLTLAQDDIAGLAAAACGEASTQSWIVGGSTDTGASDVLVLSNPGDVTATVMVTAFGVEQKDTSLVIPAQTQIALAFASVTPAAAEAPIVKIVSEGAPVRAALQSALTSTLDPAGAELQAATTEAAEQLLFAGVQVVARAEGADTAALRLLSADVDTESTVVVRDEDGDIAAEFTAPLKAGTPLDITLSDLALGVYSVEVSASTALVGGVWQSTGTGLGTDFAWMTPAMSLTDETPLAVPRGPSPRLHLVNPSGEDRTVVLTAIAGADREITVPAGESLLVPVRPNTGYEVSGAEGLSAAVLMHADGALAGWPVTPGAAADADITVHP